VNCYPISLSFFSLRPQRPPRLIFLAVLRVCELLPYFSLFFSLRPQRPLRLIFLAVLRVCELLRDNFHYTFEDYGKNVYIQYT